MQQYDNPNPRKTRYLEIDRGFGTPCWEWQMYRNHKGYGRLRLNGKNNPAHRLYYERYKGPIPDGYHIDHLCRNRACVNPDHLEPVTPAENIRRGKGAKLTYEQVEEIRSLEGSLPVAELAKRFGVHRSQISRIWNGDRWKQDSVVAVNKNIKFLYRIPGNSPTNSHIANLKGAENTMDSTKLGSSGTRGGTQAGTNSLDKTSR